MSSVCKVGWLAHKFAYVVTALQKGAAQLGALQDMLVSLADFKGKMGGKDGSAGVVEAMLSEVRRTENLVRSQHFRRSGAVHLVARELQRGSTNSCSRSL